MSSILIKNGRILDPAVGRDEVGDLFLRDGVIAELPGSPAGTKDETHVRGKKNSGTVSLPEDTVVLDASGCYVMPGLIDMHVHLRDPGQTWKEDVSSGSRAAAAGGFTTIVAMPNTRPTIDSPDRVDYVRNKAAHVAPVHVLQAGSVTKGLKGEELSDIRGMAAHGIPAISEDGRSVMNARLCREAMEIAAELHLPFLDHCEDAALVNGGCVNEDSFSRKEHLKGISNSVEDVIAARDILLAGETGAQLHLCHCSTKLSYQMLKRAKEQGFSVSGEVCPHHFTLTSADRIPGDTNYKMNPPLRTGEDREALLQGLADGTFEVISTDHAPHTAEEKQQPMDRAPFGIVGLETCVPLTVTQLVKKGILTPLQMAEKLSGNPARLLHLEDRGSLEAGKAADVTIINPEEEYCIDAGKFYSRGRNTPFDGMKVSGRVRVTICGGKIVYRDGRLYG